MKFRKLPVTIEAVQISTEREAQDVAGVCTGGPDCPKHGPDGSWPHVHSLEGDHTWTPGDWLITGVKGERYFCKPDIFAATYEPADAVEALTAQPAPSAVPVFPALLPESMSRNEVLSYYSNYANVVAHEALQYQKRIRDLEAAVESATVQRMAQAAPATSDEQQEHECETCQGAGTIDERLGGEYFSNPAATCPDCDGKGCWIPSVVAAPALDEMLTSYERLSHRAGELWERCQGKGWPAAESAEFERLRDKLLPGLRGKLRAALAGTPAVAAPGAAGGRCVQPMGH